jgi:hypothetical protein
MNWKRDHASEDGVHTYEEEMVPLLVSVAAGGLIVGLLAGAIGLLLVRAATPPPAKSVPARRQIRRVEQPLGDDRQRRSAA